MANNQVDLLVRKGTPLPVTKRSIHRTAYAYRKGGGGEQLRIPVVQGDILARADRNPKIGELVIPTTEIRRDLPSGAEVEIELAIDASQIVTTRAYVPILDQHFEVKFDMQAQVVSASDLTSRLDKERERLSEARRKASSFNDPKARDALARIDQEQTLDQVERLVQAGGVDPAALQEGNARLRDLQAAIDKADDALAWPALVEEAEQKLKDGKQNVAAHGEPRDKQRWAALETDIRRSIEQHDADRLRQQLNEAGTLLVQLEAKKPEFWIGMFGYLEMQQGTMRDKSQAEQLLNIGRKAMNGNDVEGLKAACRQLLALLPADVAAKSGYGGGTIR